MGGSDELANLVTLCDGCHAAHHPNLSGGLAKRVMERWAVRIAKLFDPDNAIDPASTHLGPALRLLGVARFRDGQLPVVQAALAGKSVLVVRPTGSGKTLCFQMPALMRPGVTVVVSPLKALMAEQVSTLLRRKVPATFVNSDLSFDEKKLRYSLLRRGAIKLLHIAPERFFVRSEAERARLAELRPAFLVIDEAHCVDQWGRDFRPEYSQLAEVREKLGNPPVLAFTATAGAEMQQRILASLGIPDAEVFVSGIDRPNIALLRWQVPVADRTATIAGLMAIPLGEGQKALVFVPSTKVGETLQQELIHLGFDVPLYHSKLGNSFAREQLVKRFTGQSQPEISWMITTSAFGMGIDIRGLRMVIHWQHPASVEDLLQELGRAGRDGNQAAAIVFHEMGGTSDVKRLRFMAEKTASDDSPSAEAALESRYSQIKQVAEMMGQRSCYRKLLKAKFENERRKERSFGMAFLEWVFSEGVKRQKVTHCCDFCNSTKKPQTVEYIARLVAVSTFVRQETPAR